MQVNLPRRPGRAVAPLALLLGAQLGGYQGSAQVVERPPLRLIDNSSSLGCREVEGAYIVFVRPGLGAVVLSAASFPGGTPVGSVVGQRLRFSVPGLRMREYELESRNPAVADAEVWGMLARDLAAPDRTGCIGFDHLAFADAEALGAYVRWAVEDVLLGLPPELLAEERAPRLFSRRVALEVSAEGRPPVCLTGQGGEPMEFRLSGSELTYVLVPVALDPEGARVFVKLGARRGAHVDPASSRAIVATKGRSVEAAAVDVDPPLRIRVLDARPTGSSCP